MDFFGPQKYNHVQLIRDLRSGDDDVAILTLRTIMNLQRSNFRTEKGALEALLETLEELLPGWPDEVKFYATSAVDHVKNLQKQTFGGDEEEESLEDAPIDLAELDSHDMDEITHCLAKIAAQEHTPALEPISRMIPKEKDPAMLAALIECLGAIGTSKELFLLKEFTGNPNARVRATCVPAIARLARDPNISVPMIEPFLEDKDENVQAVAVRFVGAHDFDKVEELIGQLLGSKEVSARATLAESLSHLESEGVNKALRTLADDPEDIVRIKVMESLNRTDHPQKIFIAEAMKRDSSDIVRRVARDVIEQFQTKRLLQMGGFGEVETPQGTSPPIKSIDEMVAEEELDAINLDDLRSDDVDRKLKCLLRIRQRAFRKGYQAVKNLLGTTENVTLLREVLRCLTVIGSGRDVDAVMHFLSHVNPRVRAAAGAAIAQVANRTQTIFLLLPMLHDEDLEVRGVAARTLLDVELPEILKHIQAMSTWNAVPIRGRLMKFLSHYHDADVVKLLQMGAQDKAPQVRFVIANLGLPLEDWADQIFAVLGKDPVEQIQQLATRAQAVRQRKRSQGATTEPLPTLQQIHEVAARFAEEAKPLEAQREAEEAAALKGGAVEDVDKSAMEAFVDRMTAPDEDLKKDLEMLEMNRDVLYEAFGRKVYQLIKGKKVTHADFERNVYIVDKYTHIEKGKGKKQEKEVSLWGALKSMAGVTSKDEEKSERIKETIRENYIEIAHTAIQLSYKENLDYPGLQMEFLEVEKIAKRIEDWKVEHGMAID